MTTPGQTRLVESHSLWEVMNRARLHSLWDVMACGQSAATTAVEIHTGHFRRRCTIGLREWIFRRPAVKWLTRRLQNPAARRWGKVIALSAIAHALVFWLLAVHFFPDRLASETISSLILEPPAPVALSESVAIAIPDTGQPKTDIMSLLVSSSRPVDRGLLSTRVGGQGGNGGAGNLRSLQHDPDTSHEACHPPVN